MDVALVWRSQKLGLERPASKCGVALLANRYKTSTNQNTYIGLFSLPTSRYIDINLALSMSIKGEKYGRGVDLI